MSVALAVWSVVVAPGEKEIVITPNGLEIRITNVALGESLEDEQGRTTVKFTYDPAPKPEDLESDAGSDVGEKATTVLCSLTPGKIEQATVDLILDSNEEFVFEVVGKNTVYLTGNYIQQGSSSDTDSDSDDEDEGAFRLEDVSSDVEVDPAELDELEDDSGRFEELENVDDEKKVAQKGKKRPAEGMDVDDEAPPADGKLSKAQKKALKKQKGENGQAVPVASPETKADGEKKKEKKKEKKETGAGPNATELKELQGGVKYRDIKVGDGANAKKGATVKMRYIGKLTNGTIFDKNTNGKPFAFNLGSGEVIKGWDVGVAGMKVGGERELIIPPEMGYGKRKTGSIPPGSTLRFEVKLLAVN